MFLILLKHVWNCTILENDPSEQSDVSEKYPDILTEMKAILKNEHTYNTDFPLNNFK